MQNVYGYKTKKGEQKYYIKITIDNKQYIKRGFDSKRSAAVYIPTLISAYKKKSEYICEDLTKRFIDYLYSRYKEASAYRYSNLYNQHILPYFGKLKVSKVTNHVLETFNNNVNKIKLKSITNIIFLSKVYVMFLRKYGLDPAVTESNLYVFKKQYVEPKKFDYYTYEEFEQLLSVIDSPMYKLIFLLLFDYGLRIGELRGLKHSDIVMDKVYIKRAVSNKTGSHKQVITSVKSSASLRDYPLLIPIRYAYEEYAESIKHKSDDFLFPSNKKEGCVIGESTIKRAQVEYCKRANLKVIKLHEFRHSCATYLFNKGAEIELVASWLGHADISTTIRVYAHLLPSRKTKMAQYFQ